MIASGKVQKPSLAITGDVLLTVIVPLGASGAAKLKYVSRLAPQNSAHAANILG